jgi:hypothetical protein
VVFRALLNPAMKLITPFLEVAQSTASKNGNSRKGRILGLSSTQSAKSLKD